MPLITSASPQLRMKQEIARDYCCRELLKSRVHIPHGKGSRKERSIELFRLDQSLRMALVLHLTARCYSPIERHRESFSTNYDSAFSMPFLESPFSSQSLLV